jgi:Ca2+/H+ antiporter, TMEM165/GDT1 family
MINWAHLAAPIAAAFLASFVEFVEALTVILAVGAVRGWRSALCGATLALAALGALVAVLGPSLMLIPLALVQIAVGALVLLFGLRWLRKAVLRAAGVIPLHDEAAAYASSAARMRALGAAASRRLDGPAVAATFKITLLEGLEVVFIVVAVGAGGVGFLVPAIVSSLAALVIVAALGLAVHRPLARVPENSLKLGVGVLLSSFGAFWFGEGVGLKWPGGDWSILGLVAGFAMAALACAAWARLARQRGPSVAVRGGA